MLAIRDSVYPSVDAAQRIAMLLRLPREPWMQDWPIEVTDADRLDEFICFLETEQMNDDERFILMELVVSSADDAACMGKLDDMTWSRISAQLQQDILLYSNIIRYWSLIDGDWFDGFEITPRMREIWERVKGRISEEA